MIASAIRRRSLQQRTAEEARRTARRLWRQVDQGAIIPSWRQMLPQLAALIAGMQVLAAQTADTYVNDALNAQNLELGSEGTTNPQGLSGFASDGWPLASLLVMPAVQAARLMQQGVPASRAVAFGRASLEMIASTQVNDAFRIADSVASTSRRATTYVRVLGPNPCSRCIMLAGQVSWKTAFRRHPNCSCSTLPSTQAAGREYATDPKAYFESLSREEQDRIFTKAGAQAIRDGADMNRVINARRKAAGMQSASERGRLQRRATPAGDRFVTFEDPFRLTGGGVAPRLMPESIYEIARDQEHAIQLLKRHGYILDLPAYLPGPDGRLTRVR